MAKVRVLVAIAAVFVALVVVPTATAFVDKDCSDFSTWRQAQHYFHKHGGPRHDPSGLDGDHDGIACEDLPGAP
jgi:hypothetical protein